MLPINCKQVPNIKQINQIKIMRISYSIIIQSYLTSSMCFFCLDLILYFTYLIIIQFNTVFISPISILYRPQKLVPHYKCYRLSLLSLIKMQSNFSIISLPSRKRGSHLNRCSSISLTSNLFKVQLESQQMVSIIAFRLKPQVYAKNNSLLKNILKNSRRQIEAVIGPFVSSGKTLFTTSNKLNTDEVSFQIGSNPTYQMTVKKVRSIDLKNISSQDKTLSGPVYLFLNNLIKNFMAQLDFTQMGKTRNYFDPSKRMVLRNAGVMLFSGYSTRFNLLQKGLFLQINPITKIIRTESVLELINKIYSTNNELSKSQKRMLIQDELINKMVMANYGKNICYLIEEVIFDVNLENYIFQLNGVSTNLIQYYLNNYQITIKNLKQPLLKASTGKEKKKKENIIIVPQLLLMSGLPANFDERKRRQVSQKTIIPPNNKQKQLQNLMSNLNNGQASCNISSVAEKLGIKISTNLCKIEAKKLNNPILQLGGKQNIQESKVGGFILYNKPLFDTSIELKICLIATEDFESNSIKNIMNSTCRNIAIRYFLKCCSFNFNDTRKIQTNITSLLMKERHNCNIYWFILPANSKQLYKTIKKITLNGPYQKPTQFSLTSTLAKKNFNSIFTKILLQMAAKIGNKLWVPKLSKQLKNYGVLMISIQNYKDSARKGMTVVAYCSTVDQQLSSFNSNYCIQESDNAIKLKPVIIDCMNKYFTETKRLPGEVIILKNGTCNNDIGVMLRAEVKDVQDQLQLFAGTNPAPKLTYIVVDKNSKQQFYLQKNGQTVNPFFGSLINSGVVSQYYDFYMVAQNCNRGTAKPTYYKVIYTTSNMEEGVLQELIFNECFNYANWMGPVRVPGTLQYAKKLASFVGQYINQDSQAQEITNTLYYI